MYTSKMIARDHPENSKRGLDNGYLPLFHTFSKIITISNIVIIKEY